MNTGTSGWPKCSGTGEVLIAKQRHGPIGKVTLRFDGETTRFDNFVRSDHLPDGAL